jgi:iron complex transport system ATP-binding protein
MTAASVSGAVLRLGGRAVVDGVSLDLKAGEVLALVGPNGAGKSSLLKLIAGEHRPSAGRVALCGKPAEDWKACALARRRAVVPQDTHLDFAFSVFEVVMMGRSPHVSVRESDADRDAVMSALERVQAAHLARRLYPTLSGGERQRVQIARALAQIAGESAPGPRCLLLDEHTASLDPAHQHGMFRLAREVAAEGVGVLAVVHDLGLAAAYADRVAVLDRGRLVALGPPEPVLTSDAAGDVFGLVCVVMRNPLDGSSAVVTAPRAAATLGKEARA